MTEQFAFEEISEDELKKALAEPTGSRGKGKGKNKTLDYDNRTETGWFALPHIMQFCTVPTHAELQQLIRESDPEKKHWRETYEQTYPNRMITKIHPYQVCRDCFIAQADIDCLNDDLPPLDFSESADN